MEITFGAIFGCVLALGLWCNRHHIATNSPDEQITLEYKTENTALLCKKTRINTALKIHKTRFLCLILSEKTSQLCD